MSEPRVPWAKRLKRRIPFYYPLMNRWRYYRKARRSARQAPAEVFARIHEANAWGDGESLSGAGSNRAAAAALSARLPGLLVELGVCSLLDLPCGDRNWIRALDLPLERYHGADIVDAIVTRHQAEDADPRHTFSRLDLTCDELPRMDALLCRDCLVHLGDDDLRRALDNIRRHGFDHLLLTQFETSIRPRPILTGEWRPLDLCRPPWNLPRPREVVVEASGRGRNGRWVKQLAVWSGADLR